MGSSSKKPASTHTSGVQYLTVAQFDKNFPYNPREDNKDNLDDKLGEGGSGKVFKSGNKYVVKVYGDDPENYADFVEELDIYAAFEHPCILKPIAWTINEGVPLLAMGRGENIMEAYRLGKIPIERIIYDTCSAIEFLNSNGIMHADIKPQNMLYKLVEGKPRCFMIDMGLARKAELNKSISDEKSNMSVFYSKPTYYLKDIAYTVTYRDPEYVIGQPNNMNAEVYSLVASYMAILEGKDADFGEAYEYDCGIEKLQWLFDEASKFQSDRLNTTQILQRLNSIYKFPQYKGIPSYKPIATTYSPDNVFVTLKWLVKEARVENYKAQTMFLALDLIHRTYEAVLTESDIDGIKIYMCAALNLALIAVAGEDRVEVKFWRKFCQSQLSKDDFKEIFKQFSEDILIVSRGIITTYTYWDYAKSADDLFPLLLDSLNGNYNSAKIRPLSSVSDTFNKCIKLQDFIFEDDLQTIDEYQDVVTVERRAEVKVEPCVLDLTPNVKIIEKAWKLFDKKSKLLDSKLKIGIPVSEKDALELEILNCWEETVSATIHNRAVLADLDYYIARDIFKGLLEESKTNYVYSSILDKLCKYDWRTYSNQVLAEGVHPFSEYRVKMEEAEEDLVGQFGF
jgi:serine/threonine protein kinase